MEFFFFLFVIGYILCFSGSNIIFSCVRWMLERVG